MIDTFASRAREIICDAAGPEENWSPFDSRLLDLARKADEAVERLQEELQDTAMEALTAQGQAWEASERIDAQDAEIEQLTAELASCRRLYNDLYSGEFAEIAAKLRDADAVIRRLNSGAELQAIMAAHNDTLAKLREAVEWVRETRKWCQEGLSGQHERLAEQALERIHEATGDFLANMEKSSD
jgi:chromosome segregation ATPase